MSKTTTPTKPAPKASKPAPKAPKASKTTGAPPTNPRKGDDDVALDIKAVIGADYSSITVLHERKTLIDTEVDQGCDGIEVMCFVSNAAGPILQRIVGALNRRMEAAKPVEKPVEKPVDQTRGKKSHPWVGRMVRFRSTGKLYKVMGLAPAQDGKYRHLLVVNPATGISGILSETSLVLDPASKPSKPSKPSKVGKK